MVKPPPDPPKPSWWTVPQTREAFDEAVRHEAERMNAIKTTQHVQRHEGDR